MKPTKNKGIFPLKYKFPFYTRKGELVLGTKFIDFRDKRIKYSQYEYYDLYRKTVYRYYSALKYIVFYGWSANAHGTIIKGNVPDEINEIKRIIYEDYKKRNIPK